MEYEFTAKMEELLENNEEGKITYLEVMKKFYDMFKILLDNAKKENNSKILGVHPDGDEIFMRIGRYGPVLEKINKKTKKKIYAPIKEPLTMENITMKDAIEILEYPKILGQYGGSDITINKGKYGIFLKYEKENYKIPEIKELTLENAINIIKELKKKILWEKSDKQNKYTVLDGKYGLFISIKSKKTLKNTNIKLPKNINPENLTIEKIKELKSSQKKFFKKFEKK